MRYSGNSRLKTCFISMVLLCFLAACSQDVPEAAEDDVWHPLCGLNESHSQDWAQITKNGIIGVSYFQKFEGSPDEGTLTYKTIRPDGSETVETVATGTRLEISVLLFDGSSRPHIFVANSTATDQTIVHYYKNNNEWQSETALHFYNEGGIFIYELSAAPGPDGSFHLLILKTCARIDSSSDILSWDYLDAHFDSHLYHATNASGSWLKELIHRYDMIYTYDMYIKILSRQDMKVDDAGAVHVVFGEQINSNDYENSPSRLCYATNKTGSWVIETASNYASGSRDDAGWFPSLCLDKAGTPHVSCMYVQRCSTGSAVYAQLLFLKRIGMENWRSETIAEYDDGYYGSDGRNFTGALSHLVFDDQDAPHIAFSDVASFHEEINGSVTNVMITGNVRHAVRQNGSWSIATKYHQPAPVGFFNAVEMHGMCLLISAMSDTIHVIGQELTITAMNTYTCQLVHLTGNASN